MPHPRSILLVRDRLQVLVTQDPDVRLPQRRLCCITGSNDSARTHGAARRTHGVQTIHQGKETLNPAQDRRMDPHGPTKRVWTNPSFQPMDHVFSRASSQRTYPTVSVCPFPVHVGCPVRLSTTSPAGTESTGVPDTRRQGRFATTSQRSPTSKMGGSSHQSVKDGKGLE